MDLDFWVGSANFAKLKPARTQDNSFTVMTRIRMAIHSASARFAAGVAALSVVAVPVAAMPESAPAAQTEQLERHADEPVVATRDGVIELTSRGNTDRTFQIYSIVGQLVRTVTVRAGDTEQLELRAGCYVVRCGRWSKKVVVK